MVSDEKEKAMASFDVHGSIKALLHINVQSCIKLDKKINSNMELQSHLVYEPKLKMLEDRFDVKNQIWIFECEL